MLTLSTWGLIIGPALMWGWFFYQVHRYKRSNLKLLFVLFLGGLFSGLIALTLNHLVEKYTLFWSHSNYTVFLNWDTGFPIYRAGFWFMVGWNEEFAKLLILLLGIYPTKFYQEPFDGILFAVAVALGFAVIENLFYLQQYGQRVLFTRSLITLPAHTFMTIPLGYYIACSRIYMIRCENTPSNRWVLRRMILKGWVIAAFLHGLYDFWLGFDLNFLAYLQVFLMGVFCVRLAYRSLEQSSYRPPRKIPSKLKTLEKSSVSNLQ